MAKTSIFAKKGSDLCRMKASKVIQENSVSGSNSTNIPRATMQCSLLWSKYLLTRNHWPLYLGRSGKNYLAPDPAITRATVFAMLRLTEVYGRALAEKPAKARVLGVTAGD